MHRHASIDFSTYIYIYIYLKVLLEKYGVFIAALSSLQRREGENGISYVLRISGSSPIWFRRDEDICNQREETAYSCFERTVYSGHLYTPSVCVEFIIRINTCIYTYTYAHMQLENTSVLTYLSPFSSTCPEISIFEILSYCKIRKNI